MPREKTILIVESPAKCKTLNKILNSQGSYYVIASKGHIAQVETNKSAVSIDDNIKINWNYNNDKIDPIFETIDKYNAKNVILATDLDREGEAISWHLFNVLKEKYNNSLKYKRMIFNEITEKAIIQALGNLKDINMPLVNAYITRLVLDFKIGFEITPVMWRFLRVFKNQSAGRVQSPSLGILVEKEKEISQFQSKEYYVEDIILSLDNQKYQCYITKYKNKAISTFYKKEKLQEILDSIPSKLTIEDVKSKKTNISPNPPFTTSSLQQAASNQLGFSVSKTMSLAQKLYEGIDINGEPQALITYMRTDNCSMSKEGIEHVRNYISNNFDKEYMHSAVRVFKNKQINAQESHECIRPINIQLDPESLSIDKELKDLYNLIWKRAICSQMSNAISENNSCIIKNNDYTLEIKSSYLFFDGFKKLHNENSQTNDLLLKKGDILKVTKKQIKTLQTKPPTRFSEAKFVSEMEKLGIGRPSTYGYIVDTLKKREYIYVENKSIYTTQKGIITFFFLYHHFNRYIDYKFTSDMEENLDKISNQVINYEQFLCDFNLILEETLKEVSEKKKIIQTLSQDILEIYNVKCSSCKSSDLELQVKFSFFFRCRQCSQVEAINSKKYTFGNLSLLITDSFKRVTREDIKFYLPKRYKFQEAHLPIIEKLPFTYKEYNIASNNYGFLVEKNDKKKYYKDFDKFKNYLIENNIPF